MTIAPVICTVETKAPPDRAFALFATRIGEWWPGRTIGRKPHVAIVIEPHLGGSWFERAADGEETRWGKVLVWDPPGRLVLGWQLDSQFRYDPAVLTEVEISFAPAPGGGTVVRLEHRDLERYGAEAGRIAQSINGGWAEKLAGFAQAADRQGVAA